MNPNEGKEIPAKTAPTARLRRISPPVPLPSENPDKIILLEENLKDGRADSKDDRP